MVFILVVTADSEIGKQLKQILGAQGWWVTQVEDRQRALRAAADQEPELLIIDSSVSGVVDLIRTFASENGGPGALVLGPSGQHDETFALFEAGADEILSNPPRAEELVRAVHRVAALPHRRSGSGPVIVGEQLTATQIFGDILNEVESLQQGAAALAVEGSGEAQLAGDRPESETPVPAPAILPFDEEDTPPLEALPGLSSETGWQVPKESALLQPPAEEVAEEYLGVTDPLLEETAAETSDVAEAEEAATTTPGMEDESPAYTAASRSVWTEDEAALGGISAGGIPGPVVGGEEELSGTDVWGEDEAALGGIPAAEASGSVVGGEEETSATDVWADDEFSSGGLAASEISEPIVGGEEETSATDVWADDEISFGGLAEEEVSEPIVGGEEETSATDAWADDEVSFGGLVEDEVSEPIVGGEEETSETDVWGEGEAAFGAVLAGEAPALLMGAEEKASEPGVWAEEEVAAIAATAEEAAAAQTAGIDERFGQYRLEERVAVGGMAEVWRASMSGLEGFRKTVAIKKILPHLADNEDFVAMFIDEAKLAAQLNHENLVDIYDLGKIDSDYFIAMEFVDGKDLRSILNCLRRVGDRMPLGLALFIAAKTAGALEYAHTRRGPEGEPLGLVHRDVSPRNILIGYGGNIRLCDFGVAKAVSSVVQTEIGALKGKLQYMSPEQASGARVDARSDIFSLGSVLFELVTGRRLFVEDTEISLLEAVRRGVVDKPRDVEPTLPEDLNRVLLKVLEKDPADRYQSAGALQRELEDMLYTLASKPTQKALGQWVCELFDRMPKPDDGEVSAEVGTATAVPSSADAPAGLDREGKTAKVAGGEVETRPLELGQLVRQRRFWLGVAAGLAVAIATTVTLELLWRGKEWRTRESVSTEQVIEGDSAMRDPESGDQGKPDTEELVDREIIKREAEIRESLDAERRQLLEELERIRAESEDKPPPLEGESPDSSP
jgi:serine/threonine protein kinase/CheY-like chemotaxis protein